MVQLQGNLLASTDISEFTSPEWITFEYVNNVIFIGSGGLINGQGPSVWKNNDCSTNTDCVLPPCVSIVLQFPLNSSKISINQTIYVLIFVQNIKFNHAKNIIVRGLTSVDPKGFHIHVYACHNIRFQKLQLNAPEESPNTDGIHTSNSSYIKITKSKISTGDDCVSVGQGSSNIYVSDVTCAVRDTGSGNV